MSNLTEELESVSAKSVLLEAYTELYSGMLFMRAGFPADAIDTEHLKAAYKLLEVLVKANR